MTSNATQRKDAIDYFQSQSTDTATVALALFDGASKNKVYQALVSYQSGDGSWGNSLAITLQKMDFLLQLGYDISDSHIAAAAEWIFWQQNGPNSYRIVFPSPTESELNKSMSLPTGEKLPSHVSYCHIYGEMALRVLIDAGLRNDPRVRDMSLVFDNMVKSARNGIYCCKNCTAAFWQVAARYPKYRMHVAEGLRTLKNYRTREGNWKGFPFYFILQTLGRIKGLLALEEFEFALERLARTQNADGSWGKISKDEKTFAVLSGIKSLRIGEV